MHENSCDKSGLSFHVIDQPSLFNFRPSNDGSQFSAISPTATTTPPAAPRLVPMAGPGQPVNTPNPETSSSKPTISIPPTSNIGPSSPFANSGVQKSLATTASAFAAGANGSSPSPGLNGTAEADHDQNEAHSSVTPKRTYRRVSGSGFSPGRSSAADGAGNKTQADTELDVADKPRNFEMFSNKEGE